MKGFQVNLGKQVPEWQTGLDFAEATDALILLVG